jgi:hypothetical protein
MQVHGNIYAAEVYSFARLDFVDAGKMWETKETRAKEREGQGTGERDNGQNLEGEIK